MVVLRRNLALVGMSLITLTSGCSPQPAIAETEYWIRQLGSQRIDERKEAAVSIKAMGKQAIPALEEAAGSTDEVLALQAKRILASIRIREKLTPKLVATKPSLEEELLEGGSHAWTNSLFAILEEQEHLRPKRTLTTADVEPLLEMALHGAINDGERIRICNLIGDWGFRKSGSLILGFVTAASAELRIAAVNALGDIGAKESIPQLIERLEDVDLYVRLSSAVALGKLDAADASPYLIKLVNSKNDSSGRAAIEALGILRAKDSVPLLLTLLDDVNGLTRLSAIKALADLGSKQAVSSILRRLEDMEMFVRREAIIALATLGSIEAEPQIRAAMVNPGSRDVAAAWLVQMGFADGAQVLLTEIRKAHPGTQRRHLQTEWMVKLNRLRNPESWTKLSKIPLQPRGESSQALAREIGRLSGLTVLQPEGTCRLQDWWRSEPAPLRRPYGSVTALDTLIDLQMGEFALLLEPGCIRFMPIDEAFAYWEAWISERK